MTEAIGSTNLISSASQTVAATTGATSSRTSQDKTTEKNTSSGVSTSAETTKLQTASQSTNTALLSLDTLLASLEENQPKDPEAAEGGSTADAQDAKSDAQEDGKKDNAPTDLAQLTEADLARIRQLSLQDSQVRLNEEAHVRVGGQYAGSPSYEFETGPDNRQYAISGEVSFNDTPIAGNPEATIRKLSIVKNAALAPAEPSTQDRAIASKASNGITQAQAQLRAQQLQERAEANREEADAKLAESRAEAKARNEAQNASASGEETRRVPSNTAVQFAGPTPYEDGSITAQSSANAFDAADKLTTDTPAPAIVTSEIS
ncbi:putative metalloprotease CJM1_0395 family protein [Aestuariispira insulae]|uniref:putative metalloprotease CJM1_0395 family protein n=1 Tax=Aestuariispira insulae TaxID=1461337 RepID=UPI0015F29D98|nr:putative metalloprotease CJM1_0395 family protein [Aestuariispira insulae]